MRYNVRALAGLSGAAGARHETLPQAVAAPAREGARGARCGAAALRGGVALRGGGGGAPALRRASP
jgi:hypothetical protein